LKVVIEANKKNKKIGTITLAMKAQNPRFRSLKTCPINRGAREKRKKQQWANNNVAT